MSIDFKYFPQIFGEVVSEVRKVYDQKDSPEPRYEYGTYLELIEACKLKDSNQIEKYPLIWLVWDKDENQQKWIDPCIYSVSPRVFIIASTGADYTTAERYENTIEPILQPIFVILLNELQHHGNISHPLTFNYPSTDHPFWLNNADGTFDCLSAIEIKFEELNLYK
jgi:hypothetical protein